MGEISSAGRRRGVSSYNTESGIRSEHGKGQTEMGQW